MFTKSILEKRMERAYKALNEFGVDLWISVGKETCINSEPAMMFLMPSPIIGWGAVVVSRTGESVCICGDMEVEEIDAYGAFTRTIVHDGNLENSLFDVIRSFNPKNSIALNYSLVDAAADGLSLTHYRLVMRCLERVGYRGETVSSSNIMKRVKAQHGEEEIAGIERTVLAAMKIYEESRNFMRSGLTGRDIQKYFQDKVAELNAEFAWHRHGNPFVSIGTRSSYLCKRPPSDMFTAPGDLVNVDFGLRLDGFASDNQRSFYILENGETVCNDEVRRAFETVQAAERAALAACAPGVYTKVPLDTANEVFVAAGYPAVPGLGHEFGTFAHEGGMKCGTPYSIDELDLHLEEGMTFTFEPAILTSRGRLCQEECILITGGGARFLSVPQQEVWLAK